MAQARPLADLQGDRQAVVSDRRGGVADKPGRSRLQAPEVDPGPPVEGHRGRAAGPCDPIGDLARPVEDDARVALVLARAHALERRPGRPVDRGGRRCVFDLAPGQQVDDDGAAHVEVTQPKVALEGEADAASVGARRGPAEVPAERPQDAVVGGLDGAGEAHHQDALPEARRVGNGCLPVKDDAAILFVGAGAHADRLGRGRERRRQPQPGGRSQQQETARPAPAHPPPPVDGRTTMSTRLARARRLLSAMPGGSSKKRLWA